MTEKQTMLEDLDQAALRPILPPLIITQDPRPDLVDDHEAWERLLSLAYGTLGVLDSGGKFNPYALPWTLHGLRCLGCGLVKDARGWRIVAGENADYADHRERYLLQHRETLMELLETMARMDAENAVSQ